MKLLYENLHKSFLTPSSFHMHVCVRALNTSISMWVHVCMCMSVHIHECVNVRGVDCQVSFSVTLHYSFESESLTDLTASSPEIILHLPFASLAALGHRHVPWPWNVDVRIQTENLKLVKQACLSWRHLSSSLKHYMTLLKVCLLAQGGSFWIQFLRCIIWGDTETLVCKCWHGIQK